MILKSIWRVQELDEISRGFCCSYPIMIIYSTVSEHLLLQALQYKFIFMRLIVS